MFSLFENDTPLQLYHLADDGVRCTRALPTEQLQPYINYYWWLEVAPGETVLEVIPDNAIDLVMSPELPLFSILYLPASTKFSIPLNGPINYVGISFRAEAASAFFNVSMDEMSQCSPGEDTTQSLSVVPLVEGVQSLANPEQLTAVLDALVLARIAERPQTSTPVAKLNIGKALAAMQASIGMAGMEEVASQFEMSDRQFRRVMGSLFGYGPKKVQRVMRLQASLKEILVAEAAAIEDGYFDEAHKIKEVRALTGLTPGQIRKMAEIYNSMS